MLTNANMSSAPKQKAYRNLLLFRKRLKAKLEELDKKTDKERMDIANGVNMGTRRNK